MTGRAAAYEEPASCRLSTVPSVASAAPRWRSHWRDFPPPRWAGKTSGNVAVTSDYLFRGVSQTQRKPALQAGITWTADNGAYAGAWGSSISWLSDSDPGGVQPSRTDGYGLAGTFGDSGVSYDVGANYYRYPGRYPMRIDTISLVKKVLVT